MLSMSKFCCAVGVSQVALRATQSLSGLMPRNAGSVSGLRIHRIEPCKSVETQWRQMSWHVQLGLLIQRFPTERFLHFWIFKHHAARQATCSRKWRTDQGIAVICGSDRCGDRLIVLKFGTLSTLRRWVSNLYVKEFEAFLRSGQHEFSLYVESPVSKFFNWSAKHKGCTRLLL